jgi:bifunctional enzyme CysN/CysC
MGAGSTDLLRLTTAGSVDDGKSTLIGRLLYDTRSILQDQLDAVEDATRRRGEEGLNLALLTDGLRAEREQNITIDVAYRYFATSRRRFIIADTPGHVQYTRNMVTGASTAELAVVLVDARKGVLTQSRRHAFISSLLGIRHVVVAVNKMDLVGWSERAFDETVSDFEDLAAKLGFEAITFIPMSALRGDNVVDASHRMPWYGGTPLLHHLEHVRVGHLANAVDFRFPVQTVIRAGQDFRGYAGRVASGALRPGEEILVLPSKRRTRIAELHGLRGPVEEARPGDAITVTTEDDVDIGRGDTIVRPLNLPTVDSELDAILCWTSEQPMKEGTRYWLRHTTREVHAFVSRVIYRIDMDTLHRQTAGPFELNDIGRAQITTAQPLFFDPYRINRETGSFILVDPHTHDTVAAGVIRGPVRGADDLPDEKADGERPERRTSPNVVWQSWNIPRARREERNRHPAAVLWFTGLPASGKTTIARGLERRLFDAGVQTMLLDGDQVRHGLNGDLGFAPEDRQENIRRVGEVAGLFFQQGCVVICTFVSPFREDRRGARALVPEGRFLEVFIDTPLEECERRDPKGLYARARSGEIAHMTGISSPYEAPERPEIHIDTSGRDPDDIVEEIVSALRSREILPT